MGYSRLDCSQGRACAFWDRLLTSASEKCLDPIEEIVSCCVVVQFFSSSHLCVIFIFTFIEGLGRVEQHYDYLASVVAFFSPSITAAVRPNALPDHYSAHNAKTQNKGRIKRTTTKKALEECQEKIRQKGGGKEGRKDERKKEKKKGRKKERPPKKEKRKKEDRKKERKKERKKSTKQKERP